MPKATPSAAAPAVAESAPLIKPSPAAAAAASALGADLHGLFATLRNQLREARETVRHLIETAPADDTNLFSLRRLERKLRGFIGQLVLFDPQGA
jgi:hypothetical protein